MDMEAHAEGEELVVGLLRRHGGGRPRKDREEEDVAAGPDAGEDVKVNESTPSRNAFLLDVEKEEEEEEKGEEKGGEGWVGAVVNGVGEDEDDEEEVGIEEEEVIMQKAMEETVSWDISGVRGFSKDEEQEEIRVFHQTDSTGFEEYTVDASEAHKVLDEQSSHGSSFESLKDSLHLENGVEAEVISGLLYSNVEGATIHKHSNGVVGMGGEAVILEEADKEETLEEDNAEETEYDVENVLEKQNTHDLFCPNCKSCITRRVILCQKRRKVRNLRYRKVDKVEQVTVLASNSEPVVTAEDRNVAETATGIHEDPASVATEETATREVEVTEDREVFRCLSCFSFFIRTGEGPKLFWNFGGKKLGENVQVAPQELPSAKTNTFFSFFPKRKVAIEQDKTAAEELRTETREISDSLIINETIAHQNGVSLAMKGTSEETNTMFSIGLTTDSTNDADNKAAESAYAGQNGISSAMEGGLGKDTSKVLGEIRKGDTLLKDAVEDSTFSKPIVEKTAIKIEQTIEGKVKKQEPSEVIQPSAAGSWVLGQTHIEIDHTTVTVTAKRLSAFKGISALPEGLTSVPQSSLSEASAAIVNLPSAPDKLFIKDIKDLSLQSAEILQDDVKKTIDDVIVEVESSPAEEAAPLTGPQTSPAALQVAETGQARELDIVKSMVYGGLIESITSLGIVSSAAGGGASTLNTLALALANVFGGLFVIAHNLRELKNEQPSTTTTGQTQDRYGELLGNRQHFLLHATIVILSFIVFGAVAPVTYAFSFRKSDSRDYKLAAVAGASLFCIVLLAIGKAYVRRPPESYLKTISYYLGLGVTASGIAFLAGELFDYLLQKLGWFSSTSSFSGPLLITIPTEYGYASY